MRKFLLTLALAGPSWAEVPLQGKKISAIEIQGLGEEERHNAEIFLQLNRIKDEAIDGDNEHYANYLLEQGKKQIGQSLQPFGYYQPEVSYHIENKGKDELKVIYRVKAGQPVRLNKVQVDLSGAARQDQRFQQLLRENPLQSGQVLNHKRYEEYKGKFEGLAQDRGYFDGDFTRHQIAVNKGEHRADVDLAYASGPRYKNGPASFRSKDGGALPLDEDFLQRYVQSSPGQPYLTADRSQLQQDLQSSDYFAEVLVGGEPDRESKTVPMDTQLTMNKNKHYLYGIGYSTDAGIRGRFDFDRRWVNGRGHKFSLNNTLSQKDSSLEATYRIPAKNPASDYYFGRAGAQYKTTDYRNSHLYVEGGYNFRRGLWNHLYSAGLSKDNFRIGLTRGDTNLLYPRARWTYTSTKNILDPKDGFQVRAEVIGGAKGLISNVNFAQLNLDARYLYSFSPRQRLILKANGGATWTDDFNRLPPRLRYFAGGDRSLRGYDYESIGPRDASGTNVGGRYRYLGTVEYEYYFRDDWALAAFLDGGDAFRHRAKTKLGAGLGVHYYSPVGPIRLDFGHGFDKKLGDKYRMHLTIGAELDL